MCDRITLADKVELLGRELPDADELELPEPVENDVLRLTFTACHAVLVPTATIAQRIVRAECWIVREQAPKTVELKPRSSWKPPNRGRAIS